MDNPTEKQGRPPLKKNFQLRWATGPDACMHSDGEWQLHFKQVAGPRNFANKHLSLAEWLAYPKDTDHVIYYVFWKREPRSVVLENLIRSGIPKDDIEIAD